MKIAVIGRGKLGRTLARALRGAALPCALVRGHPLPRALPRADVYILAVPDGRIASVADALAPRANERAVALHCAGARDVSELAPLAARGLATAVFHPLFSFADAHSASLEGATFTLYGDARAVRTGARLARRIGAHAVTLPAHAAPSRAAAYHAAAALIANGAAALADHAALVLTALGFSEREATRGVSGLLASVARNVEQVGLPAALTGPVVRGDAATVARHLAALAGVDARGERAYAAVQPLIVSTALRAGLAREVGKQIAKLAQRDRPPKSERRSARQRSSDDPAS